MKNILILASQSKRRAKILKDCGIRYKVFPSRIKEKFHNKTHPRHLVLANATQKALCTAKKVKRGLVLGCDTLVLFKGRAIGKPRNKKEAEKILKSFSGSYLYVYTGLCLIDTLRKKQAKAVAKTKLRIRHIAKGQLRRYLSLLGPYDKAGGFSIEGLGALLFDDLEGSYFNVLGLPLGTLADLFRKIGLDILDFVCAK